MVLIKKELEKGFRGKGDVDDNYISLYDGESSDSSDSDSDHLGEAHKGNLQDQEIQKNWKGFESGSMSFISIKWAVQVIYMYTLSFICSFTLLLDKATIVSADCTRYCFIII